MLWKCPSRSLEKNKSGIQTLLGSLRVRYFIRPEEKQTVTINYLTLMTEFIYCKRTRKTIKSALRESQKFATLSTPLFNFLPKQGPQFPSGSNICLSTLLQFPCQMSIRWSRERPHTPLIAIDFPRWRTLRIFSTVNYNLNVNTVGDWEDEKQFIG